MAVWLIRRNNLWSFCSLNYTCWCLTYFFTCLMISELVSKYSPRWHQGWQDSIVLNVFTHASIELQLSERQLKGLFALFVTDMILTREAVTGRAQCFVRKVQRCQWYGWIFAATHRFESPLTGLSKCIWGSSCYVDPSRFNCILVCLYFQYLKAAVRRNPAYCQNLNAFEKEEGEGL